MCCAQKIGCEKVIYLNRLESENLKMKSWLLNLGATRSCVLFSRSVWTQNDLYAFSHTSAYAAFHGGFIKVYKRKALGAVSEMMAAVLETCYQ